MLVAVSGYHAAVMGRHLQLPEGRIRVVHNGIHLDGWEATPAPPSPATIGYLARMCRDKGLHTLVDAFIELRRRPEHADLRLRVAGVMTAGDAAFVRAQKEKLEAAGLDKAVDLLPNIDRGDKQAFARTVSVISVPATYGESFGLYVLESLAAGVPFVAPRHGAFPEVLGQTGGGVLCDPDDPMAPRGRALVAAHRRASAAGAG